MSNIRPLLTNSIIEKTSIFFKLCYMPIKQNEEIDVSKGESNNHPYLY